MDSQPQITVADQLTEIVGGLRFMELALLGLSLDTNDDRTAGDIRDMSRFLTQLRQRLILLRATPEHQIAGEALH